VKRAALPILLLVALNAPLLGWMAWHGRRTAAEENIYGIQLHLHGSLSEGPGSMRGHARMAALLNGAVDVLWWTDHDWRIAAYTYVGGFDFEDDLATTGRVPARRGGLEEARLAWEPVGDEAAALEALEIRFVPGPPPPLGERSMRLTGRAAAPPRDAWSRAEYLYRTDRSRDIASLASGTRLGLALLPHAAGADARVVLRVALSQQAPEFRGRIDYVFSTDVAAAGGKTESVERIDDPEEDLPVRQATVFVPLKPGEWNECTLDLVGDAERFGLGGEDNSLTDTSLSFEARRGARLDVQVDAYRIERPRVGQPLLERQRDLVAALPGEVTHHVGIEISYDSHMNAYGVQVPLPDSREFPHGLNHYQAVEYVHRHGGLVSLAHAFGPGGKAGVRDHREGREQARFERICDSVVSSRAYGGDLLEVGYVERYYGIEAFLVLWDRLSLAGVYVTGVGVSDSHNNLLYWTTGPNNFITWAHSPSTGEADLIAALRAGRAFFGNPARFDGAMDITCDAARMGQVVVTGSRPLAVRYAARGLARGMTARIIHNGEPAGTHAIEGDAFRFEERVETAGAGFVRFEIWDGRSPIAFSNPLYFVPEAPEGELPAARRAEAR